jgi:putative DNA primase/helicase
MADPYVAAFMQGAATVPFPQTPVVLDPADPMATARVFVDTRYTHQGQRILLHHADEWRTWTGTHYPIADDATIRAQLWTFLEQAKKLDAKGNLEDFKPTSARVANALDAMRAVCNLPATIPPPVWLRASKIPAAEIIACATGLLHIPTRRLSLHDPAFFNVNAADFDYDPDAGCPEWLRFLDALWPTDDLSGDAQGEIATLQEWFGYALTTDTRQHKILMLVGPKRGGKGTIGRVLTALLGTTNVCSPTLSSLGTNFGPWQLVDRQLAIIADARLSGRQDQHIIAERLLSISGEDVQTIDRKFKEPWTGRLAVRFMILTNELPRIADASTALPSRFIVLPLSRSFLGCEDHSLTDRLLTALPGILNWALDGWHRLDQRGHFLQPKSGDDLVQELEDLASPVATFVRERCTVQSGATVACSALFDAWKAWCEPQGRDNPGTAATFGRDLRAVVPGLKVTQPRDGPTRSRHYEGIRLG